MQRRDFLVSAALLPGLGVVSEMAGTVTSPTANTATSAASVASVPSAASAEAEAGVVRAAIAAASAPVSRVELLGGFRVVDAYEAFLGALPFVVEGEGERFQLDVLRRTESGSTGMHASEHFTVFAHGPGSPVQERGARALALALEREIRNGAPMPALASFEERQSTASGAQLHVDFVRNAEAQV